MNILAYFSAAPWALGLATIGGLVSFAYILWQVGAFLFGKRVLIGRGIQAQKRGTLLKDIKEFRTAYERKRSGLSDLAIAIPRFQLALKIAFSLFWGIVIVLFNIAISRLTKDPTLAVSSAIAVTLVVGYDFMRFGTSLHRILWVVAAVNYPSFYRGQLMLRAIKLRKTK